MVGSAVAEASEATLAVEIFEIEVLPELVRSACLVVISFGTFVGAVGGVALPLVRMQVV